VWEGLPNEYQELIYAWMMESYSPYISFSGEVRMDVEPIDEPGETGPGEENTGGSGSEEGNTDGTDPGEENTDGSGSEEGNTDGTNPGEENTDGSGSEEGNADGTDPGEGNTDGSGSEEGDADGSDQREGHANRLGSMDSGDDKLDSKDSNSGNVISKDSDTNNERKNGSLELPKMQEQKLVKTGDVSMMPLQGAGLLAFLSGIWVWVRRKRIKN
ncbi:LPXTG cell wall anchor domain-containing protein, partial [Listeria farberi]|uniref:LPXTG cell wall anchor domain-containing protein n=1 Tax=Listeria farberi TaxID=2713500 RepID=UPI001C8C76F1